MEDETPVAVAFSDSVDGRAYFRSLVESLSKIFDVLRSKDSTIFLKENKKLIMKFHNFSIDTQIKSIVDKICNNSMWSLGDIGTIDNNSSSINSVLSEYIGWANSSSES